MRINLKTFVLIACLFSVGLIGIRLFVRPPILRESAFEEPVPTVPATIPDSRTKTSVPGGAQVSSAEPTSLANPMTLALVGSPQDPDGLREWARQNPAEAFAWLQSAAAGETRDIVVEIVCARVAESSPSEAVLLAERYSGGCSNLLENLVHQWADQNEPAALAYAMRKPPGEERDRLLG